IGEIIKNISVPFAIDTINIKNSRILYSEIISGDKEPLNILFTHTNFKIRNISNSAEMIKTNPEIVISGNTKFLDAGKINISMTVPMTTKTDKMVVTGHMSEMPVEPINKMLEGPMNVRFVSGKINSMDFNFIADTKHATGSLLFDYNDFVIQLFKDKKYGTNKGKEKNKWFINTIANGIIKKSNNIKSDKFVTGKIDYNRPEDIGIPGYMFRSIKSGLISTFKPGTRRKAIKEVKQAEKIKP
ncbi:MAG: hypothetical protein GXO47_14660, partial [Chlorobi bacterium]|nr:hypothetical protein [Chlorobiota bacterium]